MKNRRSGPGDAAAADDLDVFPVVGQKRELQRAGLDRLVVNDQAFDAADEQIQPPVAVEIDDGRNVLAIEIDVLAIGVDEQSGGLEACGRLRTGVAINANVAEGLLSEKIDVAISVEVD